MKDRYAVFYITPSGESDSDGLFVARNEESALACFRQETGTSPEDEFDAHRLSAWNSKEWCEGYRESIVDAEERAELVAMLKRKKTERSR